MNLKELLEMIKPKKETLLNKNFVGGMIVFNLFMIYGFYSSFRGTEFIEIESFKELRIISKLSKLLFIIGWMILNVFMYIGLCYAIKQKKRTEKAMREINEEIQRLKRKKGSI